MCIRAIQCHSANPLADPQQMTVWKLPCKFSTELCHIGCATNQKSIISKRAGSRRIRPKRGTTSKILFAHETLRGQKEKGPQCEMMSENCTHSQEAPPRRHVCLTCTKLKIGDWSVARKKNWRILCFEPQPHQMSKRSGCSLRRYLPTRKTLSTSSSSRAPSLIWCFVSWGPWFLFRSLGEGHRGGSGGFTEECKAACAVCSPYDTAKRHPAARRGFFKAWRQGGARHRFVSKRTLAQLLVSSHVTACTWLVNIHPGISNALQHWPTLAHSCQHRGGKNGVGHQTSWRFTSNHIHPSVFGLRVHIQRSLGSAFAGEVFGFGLFRV